LALERETSDDININHRNSAFLPNIELNENIHATNNLDEFRDEMLHDDRIRIIHDHNNASDCFPGVEIKGGVCYFLWDRDNRGLCKIYTHELNEIISYLERPLLEDGSETFIRYNEAITILHKVKAKKEDSFANIISSMIPLVLMYVLKIVINE